MSDTRAKEPASCRNAGVRLPPGSYFDNWIAQHRSLEQEVEVLAVGRGCRVICGGRRVYRPRREARSCQA